MEPRPQPESECKCTYAGLLSWEKPVHTGVFLIVINIAYLIFKCMHLHLIPLLIQLTLMSTIGHILCKPFYTEQFHSECCDGQKEKMIDAMYKKFNDCRETIDNMTSMKDMKSVTTTIVTLYAIASFGNWFSTLSLMVIVFDVYVLLKYGSIKSLITNAARDTIGIASRIIYDAVPKYKEEDGQHGSKTEEENKAE